MRIQGCSAHPVMRYKHSTGIELLRSVKLHVHRTTITHRNRESSMNINCSMVAPLSCLKCLQINCLALRFSENAGFIDYTLIFLPDAVKYPFTTL